MGRARHRDEFELAEKDWGPARVLWHSIYTDQVAYVDEKMREAGVKLDDDPMLRRSYRRLLNKYHQYRVFIGFWLTFTILFYWSVIQTVVAETLIPVPVPAVVQYVVAMFIPITLPFLLFFTVMKNFLYFDVDHSKSMCLGLVASLYQRRKCDRDYFIKIPIKGPKKEKQVKEEKIFVPPSKRAKFK